MRERIIAEILRTHSELGIVPGIRTFRSHTGIVEKEWKGKIWARWGDAIRDAGLEPNKLTERLSEGHILSVLAECTLQFKRLPTSDDLRIIRRSNLNVPSVAGLRTSFPKRTDLVEALRAWVLRAENDRYSAVADMLPSPASGSSEPAASQNDGHVYLLRAGDYFKIGQSSNLEKRVKSINVALPDKATLEHAISTDDPPGIEAYWHRRFADRRANGEWFKLSKADILAFKKRKFQ